MAALMSPKGQKLSSTSCLTMIGSSPGSRHWGPTRFATGTVIGA